MKKKQQKPGFKGGNGWGKCKKVKKQEQTQFSF